MTVVIQPGDHVWAVLPLKAGSDPEDEAQQRARNERVVRSWMEDCPGVQFAWVDRPYKGAPMISFAYRPTPLGAEQAEYRDLRPVEGEAAAELVVGEPRERGISTKVSHAPECVGGNDEAVRSEVYANGAPGAAHRAWVRYTCTQCWAMSGLVRCDQWRFTFPDEEDGQ